MKVFFFAPTPKYTNWYLILNGRTLGRQSFDFQYLREGFYSSNHRFRLYTTVLQAFTTKNNRRVF